MTADPPAPARGTPAVSVIVPAFNVAETLGESIASVLAQSFDDFELLVIDDGSTDATPAIARATGDPRVRLLSFPNRGPAASRNRGIRRAAGEFIALLDGDDLWTPDKLARQLAELRAQPDAALVYSWCDCVDMAGRFLRPGSHVRASGRVYELLVTRNFLDCGSTPLIRARALAAVGPFDESLRAGEDWDMWLRLAERFPFACVPAVQVHYRVRSGSLLSNTELQRAASLAVLQRAVGRLPATAGRDRIERAARANIHKFLAVRVLETGTRRSDARQAARYWREFVRTTPTRWQHLGKALALLGGILAMRVLPPRQFARLRARLSGVGRRSATPDRAAAR